MKQSFDPDEIYTPPEGPSPVDPPSKEIFARMGEENITQMMIDFYERLEKTEIRHMFPKNMRASAKKSALFFIQIMGGPAEYSQRFGPPRMRMRHLPFAIDDKARDIWVKNLYATLENATEKYSFPPEHIEYFKIYIREFAKWMVTRSPGSVEHKKLTEDYYRQTDTEKSVDSG